MKTKTKLLIFLFALSMQLVSAQLNFEVLNGAGNPQEGVEIVLYGPDSWGSAGTHTTASNGTAAITGLADGNYHYEIYYTGSDGLRHFWGWGTNIPV
jgi:hypothetical protein